MMSKLSGRGLTVKAEGVLTRVCHAGRGGVVQVALVHVGCVGVRL